MRRITVLMSLGLLACLFWEKATIYPVSTYQAITTNQSVQGWTVLVAGTGLLLSIHLLSWAYTGRIRLNITAFALLPSAWATIGLTSYLWSAYRQETFYVMIAGVAWLVLFFLLATVLDDAGTSRFLLAGVTGIGVLLAGDGLFQYLEGRKTPAYWLGPAFRQAITTRIDATLGNPNFLAAALLLTMGANLALILLATKPAGCVLGLAAWCLQEAALFLTYSRGGYLGLFCLLAILFVTTGGGKAFLKRLAPAGLATLLLAATLPGVPNRLRVYGGKHSTALSRFFVWRSVWQGFLRHPWLGTGLGTLNAVYSGLRLPGHLIPVALIAVPGSADNDYLQLLLEAGLIGGAVLIGVAVALLIKGFGMATTGKQRWKLPLLAAVSGVAVQAFFEVTLNLMVVQGLLICLLALLAAGRGSRLRPPVGRKGRIGLLVGCLAFLAVIYPSFNYLRAYMLAKEALALAGRSPQQAERLLRTACALDQGNEAYLGALSQLELRMHQAAADSTWHQALALDPYDPALWAIGEELSQSRGELAESLQRSQKRAALDPYSIPAAYDLGALLWKNGEGARGRSYVEWSLELTTMELKNLQEQGGKPQDLDYLNGWKQACGQWLSTHRGLPGNRGAPA